MEAIICAQWFVITRA